MRMYEEALTDGLSVAHDILIDFLDWHGIVTIFENTFYKITKMKMGYIFMEIFYVDIREVVSSFYDKNEIAK